MFNHTCFYIRTCLNVYKKSNDRSSVGADVVEKVEEKVSDHCFVFV